MRQKLFQPQNTFFCDANKAANHLVANRGFGEATVGLAAAEVAKIMPEYISLISISVSDWY